MPPIFPVADRRAANLLPGGSPGVPMHLWRRSDSCGASRAEAGVSRARVASRRRGGDSSPPADRPWESGAVQPLPCAHRSWESVPPMPTPLPAGMGSVCWSSGVPTLGHMVVPCARFPAQVSGSLVAVCPLAAAAQHSRGAPCVPCPCSSAASFALLIKPWRGGRAALEHCLRAKPRPAGAGLAAGLSHARPTRPRGTQRGLGCPCG